MSSPLKIAPRQCDLNLSSNAFLGAPEFITQTAKQYLDRLSRFVQITSERRPDVACHALPIKITPSHRNLYPRMVLRVTRLSIPNGISILSAVFAQITGEWWRGSVV